MVRNPAWQMSLSALFWCVTSVSSDPEYFVRTTTSLKAPTGITVDDCRLESAVRDA